LIKKVHRISLKKESVFCEVMLQLPHVSSVWAASSLAYYNAQFTNWKHAKRCKAHPVSLYRKAGREYRCGYCGGVSHKQRAGYRFSRFQIEEITLLPVRPSTKV